MSSFQRPAQSPSQQPQGQGSTQPNNIGIMDQSGGQGEAQGQGSQGLPWSGSLGMSQQQPWGAVQNLFGGSGGGLFQQLMQRAGQQGGGLSSPFGPNAGGMKFPNMNPNVPRTPDGNIDYNKITFDGMGGGQGQGGGMNPGFTGFGGGDLQGGRGGIMQGNEPLGGAQSGGYQMKPMPDFSGGQHILPWHGIDGQQGSPVGTQLGQGSMPDFSQSGGTQNWNVQQGKLAPQDNADMLKQG